MFNRSKLILAAVAALFAGCSGGSVPTPAPRIPQARPPVGSAPSPDAIRRRMTAAATYGISQWGYANGDIIFRPQFPLYFICDNGQTTQSGCDQSYQGVTSFSAHASGAANPCTTYTGAEGQCSAGTVINDTSVGNLGFSIAANIAPHAGDTSEQDVENDTVTTSFDTVTVNSNSLPAGTQVTLQSTAALTTSGVNCGNTGSGSYTDFYMAITVWFGNAGYTTSSLDGSCNSGVFAVSGTPAGTFTATVGETFQVDYEVAGDQIVYDTNASNALVKDAVAIHDGRGTATITAVTPGVTLSFASGGTAF
jgi:hypothetical protein